MSAISTRQEFIDGMRELAADFADPDGDFNSVAAELEGEEARSYAAFDPNLGVHFANIATAIRGLGEYVKSRQG